MSDADLMPPPPPRLVTAPKAKLTIYVVLLIMSLVAVLVGCLFLYLEISSQGGFGTIQGRISSAQQPAQTLLADASYDCLSALR
jgi:hypothetical protein